MVVVRGSEMLAIFQNEYVLYGIIVFVVVVSGFIGWKRFGQWIFRGNKEKTAKSTKA